MAAALLVPAAGRAPPRHKDRVVTPDRPRCRASLKRSTTEDAEDRGLRRAAAPRLPRVVFDYIDGGAEREITMRENSRAFDDVVFRPRCAVTTGDCDLRTTILGTTLELPFLLAPVGSSRMFYPRGESVAARAAGKAGTAYPLSPVAGPRVDEVEAAA